MASFSNIINLKKFKDRFEQEIKTLIDALGDKTKLRDACEYSLTSGGKRFRPILVLMLGEALNNHFDVMPSALAVEFFHTASLIADDLPCMDDESQRRCKPTLHLAYGEATALLSSYTFLSLGYEMIAKNAKILEQKKNISKERAGQLTLISLDEISKVAGIFGATGGQFLDLYPPNRDLSTILTIIKQKTVSLFEISFVLGWLFGGGDLELLEEVKSMASCFGTAFQIADDLNDMAQDISNSNQINLALCLGKERAHQMFLNEMEGFESKLKKLNLFDANFKLISKLLRQSIDHWPGL